MEGLGPYRTAHLNRLGDHALDVEKAVSPLSAKTKILIKNRMLSCVWLFSGQFTAGPHVGTQPRAEVTTLKRGRQLAAQPLSLCGLPELETIAGVVRRDLKVLDNDIAIALQA